MATYKESWLEIEKEFGGRFALHGSAEEIHQQFSGLMSVLALQHPPLSDAVSSKDGEIDGIQYRIYTPKDAASKGPLPVGFYTHGGGYVTGDLESEDRLCRTVAEHASSIIVSVGYRLAPQHKSPTQLLDSVKVFEWAHDNAASYGGDVSRFYTIGSSAGAGLALAIANYFIDHPSKHKGAIKGIAALGPVTLHPDNVPDAYRSLYQSYEENKTNTPIIDQSSMRLFFEYAGVDPTDASCLPALSTKNHKHFPPTYITTYEFDPVRDDGTVMAHALRNAGVSVRTECYKGLPHCFWLFPKMPETKVFLKDTIEAVNWLIGQM